MLLLELFFIKYIFFDLNRINYASFYIRDELIILRWIAYDDKRKQKHSRFISTVPLLPFSFPSIWLKHSIFANLSFGILPTCFQPPHLLSFNTKQMKFVRMCNVSRFESSNAIKRVFAFRTIFHHITHKYLNISTKTRLECFCCLYSNSNIDDTTTYKVHCK